MFRKADDHKRIASVSNGIVTMMFDDGWEDLLDSQMTFKSDDEAVAFLTKDGIWEEFDPNASLKAAGLVWNGYCYAKPGKKEWSQA